MVKHSVEHVSLSDLLILLESLRLRVSVIDERLRTLENKAAANQEIAPLCDVVDALLSHKDRIEAKQTALSKIGTAF